MNESFVLWEGVPWKEESCMDEFPGSGFMGDRIESWKSRECLRHTMKKNDQELHFVNRGKEKRHSSAHESLGLTHLKEYSDEWLLRQKNLIGHVLHGTRFVRSHYHDMGGQEQGPWNKAGDEGANTFACSSK